MRKFKDANGLDWDVAVWAGNANTVRELHGVDLLKLTESSELRKLQDFGLLVAIIYTLVKPQVVLREMTEEQFGMAMVGDALSNALDAMWGAVEDFFPSRLLTRAQMRKVKAASLILEQSALTEVERMDPATIAQLVELGNLPPSPSTTAPGALN